ncbi:MAG: hypothetical protein ACLGIF_07160 [Actinomycetes bacterium]
MTGWPELVTIALLGTDRRPVPPDLPAGWGGADPVRSDPATRVLDLAARHRIAARAGARIHRASPEPPGPMPEHPPAPTAATGVLDGLLARPMPRLVDAWLGACVSAEFSLPPGYWTPLAGLASRSTAYDRRLLGAALGPPGRWFLARNPQWTRLAAAASEAVSAALPPPAPAPDPGPASSPPAAPAVTPEGVRRQPDLLFAAPTPWPEDVLDAGLEALALGHLSGAALRSFAVRLGAELPLAAYGRLIRAAEATLHDQATPLVQRRMRREGFVAAEELVWTRIEIRDGFAATAPRRQRSVIPALIG